MNIDFAKEAENNGFTVYPAGLYDVKITAQEIVIASTGTPQVKWTAIITSGAHEGGKIVDFTPMTTAGLWKTIKMLKAALGLKHFSTLGIMDSDSQAFKDVIKNCVNKDLKWMVEESLNPKNNLPRNNMVDYLPSDIIRVASLDEVPDFLKED